MNNYARLNVWREERGLNSKEGAGNTAASLLDESKELVLAIAKKDTMEVIDAFCDHIIFAINALEARGFNAEIAIGEKVSRTSQIKHKAVASMLVFKISEFILNEAPKELVDIARISTSAIYAMGYCPVKCISETIKEIESRTGEYSEVTQKWEKHRTPEAMALWYSANYKACKRPRDKVSFSKMA